MTIALLFWILYIVGLIFSAYRERVGILPSLLYWVLIGLLGVAEFGFPIK